MATTSKTLIVDALTHLGEATSYDIYEHIGNIDTSTVDKQLKVLSEEGTVLREKKSTNGGRPVYHYKLANTGVTTVAISGDKSLAVNEAMAVEAEVVGPKPIFLVRKNDIPGFTFGRGGHLFARTVSPFDMCYARRFQNWGNAVISVFVSEDSIDDIASALQAALPEITFGIATTTTEALAIVRSYGPDVNANHFANWADDYFRQFSHVLVAPLAPLEQTETAQVGATAHVAAGPQAALPPVSRSTRAIMQDIADGAPVTEEEAKQALKALAQDWLEMN